MRIPAAIVLIAIMVATPAGAVPSFEGIWSTDREASEIWPEDPGFTPRGREALDNHDPTTDDPKYYTEPWTIRKVWSRSDDEVFYEYVCSDPRYHPTPGN